MTPTARSLEECRRRGWKAHVVEKWIPHTRQRSDVWGFGDILVIDGLPGSLLIQATSAVNHSARIRKIHEQCADCARAWVAAGNRIAVWSWRKRKRPLQGERRLWVLREEMVGL